MNKVCMMAVVLVIIAGCAYLTGLPAYSQKKEPSVGLSEELVVEKGTVRDGEKVPLPGGLAPEDVTIMLSLREIDDHAQISSRIHCYLEEDGVTARVRSVAKHTMSRDPRRVEKGERPRNRAGDEIVARGKATYLLIENHRGGGDVKKEKTKE